jgi:hypothetical protein
MRVMEIPPFSRKLDNSDFENLFKARLSQTIVLCPEQAIPLVGYMGWPNDSSARDEALRIVRSRPEDTTVVPHRLRRIQYEWLRVADVFHHFWDLVDGQHQKRRGGPSIGKAITLVEANAKGRGTGAASLWQVWERYKDVAHLVTSATLICAEARKRAGNEPFGPSGLSLDQFAPFQIAMLMPDLVLAVALELEQRGLSHVSHARTEPVFNPESLWRIPADINVAPLPPPARRIRSEDKVILQARRAGNRGRANRSHAAVVTEVAYSGSGDCVDEAPGAADDCVDQKIERQAEPPTTNG